MSGNCQFLGRRGAGYDRNVQRVITGPAVRVVASRLRVSRTSNRSPVYGPVTNVTGESAVELPAPTNVPASTAICAVYDPWYGATDCTSSRQATLLSVRSYIT